MKRKFTVAIFKLSERGRVENFLDYLPVIYTGFEHFINYGQQVLAKEWVAEIRFRIGRRIFPAPPQPLEKAKVRMQEIPVSLYLKIRGRSHTPPNNLQKNLQTFTVAPYVSLHNVIQGTNITKSRFDLLKNIAENMLKTRVEWVDLRTTWPPAATMTSQRNKLKVGVSLRWRSFPLGRPLL
jgi:hypothetical protein